MSLTFPFASAFSNISSTTLSSSWYIFYLAVFNWQPTAIRRRFIVSILKFIIACSRADNQRVFIRKRRIGFTTGGIELNEKSLCYFPKPSGLPVSFVGQMMSADIYIYITLSQKKHDCLGCKMAFGVSVKLDSSGYQAKLLFDCMNLRWIYQIWCTNTLYVYENVNGIGQQEVFSEWFIGFGSNGFCFFVCNFNNYFQFVFVILIFFQLHFDVLLLMRNGLVNLKLHFILSSCSWTK